MVRVESQRRVHHDDEGHFVGRLGEGSRKLHVQSPMDCCLGAVVHQVGDKLSWCKVLPAGPSFGRWVGNVVVSVTLGAFLGIPLDSDYPRSALMSLGIMCYLFLPMSGYCLNGRPPTRMTSSMTSHPFIV